MLPAVAPHISAAEELPSIFNGKDLTGWKAPVPNPFWKVADGMLVSENDEAMKGNVLYTDAAFGDFVFEAEARWLLAQTHLDLGDQNAHRLALIGLVKSGLDSPFRNKAMEVLGQLNKATTAPAGAKEQKP